MRRQEKKVSDAKKEVDAIDLVISGINTELTAAQTDAATKKATYDAAQKVKDNTERKAKEAERAAIKAAYEEARVAREDAEFALDDFKETNTPEGDDAVFDETALDADLFAEYEGLRDHYAEIDTTY